MTPTATGRHCTACAKTVVDFTQQTEAEIRAYFQQRGSGKTCGLFRRKQLAQPLAAHLPMAPTRRWQAWLVSLLVAALTTQNCQSTIGEPTSAPAAVPPPAPATPWRSCPRLFPYSGRMLDAAFQQPVAGVRVQLKRTACVARTDVNGLFTLETADILAPAGQAKSLTMHLTADNYPAYDATPGPTPPLPGQRLVVLNATLPVPALLLGDVEELR